MGIQYSRERQQLKNTVWSDMYSTVEVSSAFTGWVVL